MDPSNPLPVGAEAEAAAALVGPGGAGSTGMMPSIRPFRFTRAEVAEMEACLQQLNNTVPNGSVIKALADELTASAERAGKVGVLPKQVWYWFKNRKYSHRRFRNLRKMLPTASGEQKLAIASASAHPGSSSGKNSLEGDQVEYEAKSASDGAWYDVYGFISQRWPELGDLEVRVRLSGFGAKEDEWINQRKEHALYFDAQVLDVQKRRHDMRGCRCRFLIRYDGDQSEEIVPLRKVCRRPETNYRLQFLHIARADSLC